VTPDAIIAALGLVPHPEGGYYKETYRHVGPRGERGDSTAIFFLLVAGQKSHWHRIDAVEMWHYYAGAPLLLRTSSEPRVVVERTLGPDLGRGELPQLVVPKGHWQAAEPLGDYCLVGCTVSPAFEFGGFELAPPDFEP
jgi:predicted cupin superfamily sugar epimerase